MKIHAEVAWLSFLARLAIVRADGCMVIREYRILARAGEHAVVSQAVDIGIYIFHVFEARRKISALREYAAKVTDDRCIDLHARCRHSVRSFLQKIHQIRIRDRGQAAATARVLKKSRIHAVCAPYPEVGIPIVTRLFLFTTFRDSDTQDKKNQIFYFD